MLPPFNGWQQEGTAIRRTALVFAVRRAYVPAKIFARRRNRERAARSNGMMAMGGMSIWHWMLFGAVALLLFGGKGKISDIMGDVAKGIKSFKKGMAEDESDAKPPAPTPPRSLENHAGAVVDAKETTKVN